MIRQPPISTRTDTLCPNTTLFRSHTYIFRGADRRVVFAIPYEADFTLIGTTDVDYSGEPAAVTVGDDEVAYLCRTVSDYLARPVAPDQVVRSEEHTSELQSLMRISYAVFCLKKKKTHKLTPH